MQTVWIVFARKENWISHVNSIRIANQMSLHILIIISTVYQHWRRMKNVLFLKSITISWTIVRRCLHLPYFCMQIVYPLSIGSANRKIYFCSCLLDLTWWSFSMKNFTLKKPIFFLSKFCGSFAFMLVHTKINTKLIMQVIILSSSCIKQIIKLGKNDEDTCYLS